MCDIHTYTYMLIWMCVCIHLCMDVRDKKGDIQHNTSHNTNQTKHIQTHRINVTQTETLTSIVSPMLVIILVVTGVRGKGKNLTLFFDFE